MTKAQATKVAKGLAKKKGASYVVYFDHRDENCREYYEYCSYDHYVRYQDVIESNVVMIVTFDPETNEFHYE
jgi:hypothetical protein